MKFLLLEDDKDLGSLISEEIRNQGFEAFWAKSVSEAQEQIKKQNFDLAILDLYLPDGKGFEVVPEIACPVIMMSALGGPENRLQGAELGV
ncbi:MAG: response regulator, partial [Bdellovibrionales bacterium]|nr:response regulator [Bdellovibrionales bacterium]NQZ19116.1 response regulator [Bdellovibrionales bacterium]